MKKYETNQMILATLATIIFSTIPNWSFAQATSVKGEDLAKLVDKVSPAIVNQIRNEGHIKIQPPNLLPSDQHIQKLDQTLKDYSQFVNTHKDAQNAAETGTVISTSLVNLGALKLATNVKHPVAVLLSAALFQVSMDNLLKDFKKNSDTITHQYLKGKMDEWKIDYDELKNNPSKLKEEFSKDISVFKDLKNRIGKNQELLDSTQDMMINSISSMTKIQFDNIQLQAFNIQKLEDNFFQFSEGYLDHRKNTESQLKNLEKDLNDLSKDAEKLKEHVINSDKRISDLEHNQDLIADFVFDHMAPFEKVAMLEKGFLQEKFRCKDPLTSCEASELKEQLIQRFQKQADVDKLLKTVASTTNVINNIGMIAGNLGIRSPELDTAIKYTNIASQAFTQIMIPPPNYLSAIATITSLFRKQQPDPEVERFNLLMGYLDKQFDGINKNLAKISEDIKEMSKAMEQGFLHINRTLARVEFEQSIINDAVKNLIWSRWKSCYAVFLGASKTDNNGLYRYIDPTTLFFKSEESLKAIITNYGETSILPCITTMQADLSSINAIERFGNFVDLKWVSSNGLNNNIPDMSNHSNSRISNEKIDEWRNQLQIYLQDVFTPAFLFTASLLNDNKKSWSTGFAILASPMISTDDWHDWQFFTENLKEFTCWDKENPDNRLFDLLCHGSKGPDYNAYNLLEQPILADVVNDVAKWVMVVAQLADRRDQVEHKWLISINDLLSKVQNEKSSTSTGEKLIESAIGVLDMSIAVYSLTYGPMAAQYLVSKLEDSEVSKSAIEEANKTLSKNGFLAANTAQLFFETRFRNKKPKMSSRRPFRSTYNVAYIDAANNDFYTIKALFGFGDDINFSISSEGKPQFTLTVDDKSLTLDVPLPGQMAAGKLSWPARYYELIATREQLLDRLYGYRMLDKITDSEKGFFAEILTR